MDFRTPNLMQMMNHRRLDQLHRCWQAAVTYIEEHAQTPEQQRDAKRRLKQQLREFMTGEPAATYSNFSESESEDNNTHDISKLPFHTASLHTNPVCAPGYPFTILWTYKDYRTLCYAGSERLGSVPFAIRHPDGKQISHIEWETIATVVKHIASNLRKQTYASDPFNEQFFQSDIYYYKCYHQERWNKAIAKLERACPIFGLCAHHWKAELALLWALEQPGTRGK